jgi:MFS family permease
VTASEGPPPPDDLAPVTVELGEIVQPDDPEDWTRPLTWAAAGGMLAAPLLALAWFWLAAPDGTKAPSPGTWLVAVVLAAGAAVAGATQLGAARALAGTVAAALFAALATIAIGLMVAGERQVGVASPTLGQAVAASVAGLAGALPAGLLAFRLAEAQSRRIRVVAPAAVGAAVALLVVPLLFVY